MFSRTKIAAIVAEFLGTGILTYAVLAAITRGTVPAAFGAGLAVAVLVYYFAKTSGAHFNPAITLGFWTAGKIKTLQAVVYVAAQVAGAFAAFALFKYIFKEASGQEFSDPTGEFKTHLLVVEALGAFILSFGVAVAAYRKYTNSQAAGVVGASLAIGVLIASTASFGFLNPALGLGILGIESWVWGVYVVGPVLGAIIGVNLYAYLFDDERISFKQAVAEVSTETTVVAKEVTAKKVTKTAVKKPVKTTKKVAAKTTAKKKTTK